MKKLAITIICLIIAVSQIYCQDQQNDVNAPDGDNVVAWTRSPDFTNYWRNYYDSVFTVSYPNATKINTYGGYSTTKEFNCHGYAWHVSEGGANRWIGYNYGNTDEHIYWTGGSYTQISSQHYPGGKVSYASDDHSAVVADPSTYGSGWFVSKWGDKVLMRHAYDDCPYTSTNLKYYRLNPILTTNSGALCNNVQRTVNSTITHMPSATHSWTKNSYLTYVSGAGTTNYTVKGTSGSGSGQVTYQISTPSGFSWTVNKDIWVGKPNYNNLILSVDDDELSNCDHTYADADYSGTNMGILEYDWDIPNSSDWYIDEEYGSPAGWQYVEIDYFDHNPPSQEAIHVRARNGCGWSLWKEFWVDVDDCAGGYYSFAYNPNPADEILTVSFDAKAEKTKTSTESLKTPNQETTKVDGKPVEIAIYNKDQKRVLYRQGNTAYNMELDISSIQPGSYFIHVSIEGDKTYKKHLIIE